MAHRLSLVAIVSRNDTARQLFSEEGLEAMGKAVSRLLDIRRHHAETADLTPEDPYNLTPERRKTIMQMLEGIKRRVTGLSSQVGVLVGVSTDNATRIQQLEADKERNETEMDLLKERIAAVEVSSAPYILVILMR